MSERPIVPLTRADVLLLYDDAIARGDLERAEEFAAILLAENDDPDREDA